MIDSERDKVMTEIREIRKEIKDDLIAGRSEYRSDIRDLHCKIDKRFLMLNEKFEKMSGDVTTHKAHFKTLVGVVTIALATFSTWVVTYVKDIGS